MQDGHGYQPILHGSKEQSSQRFDLESQQNLRDRCKAILISYGRTVALAAIALIAVTQLSKSFLSSSHSLAIDSEENVSEPIKSTTPNFASLCGTNSQTARQNNCLFDPIAFAWLPPACFDQKHLSQHLNQHDWTWYEHEVVDRPQRPCQSTVLPHIEVIAGRYDSVSVSSNYMGLRHEYLISKERNARKLAPNAWMDVYSSEPELESESWTTVVKHALGLTGRDLVTLDANFPACLPLAYDVD